MLIFHTSVIDFQDEEIYPVIVKALPDLGLADDLIKSFNVFPKEIEMYAEIIPNFEAIYREFGEIVQFAPKYVYFHLTAIHFHFTINIQSQAPEISQYPN